MILQRLRINNFRQYYGKQEIEFAHGDKKNVTVIKGTTGAGKTNMFLAISWCLYGAENIMDSKGEIINKHAKAEDKERQATEAWVELRFTHTDLTNTESTFVAMRTTREPDTLRLSKVTNRGLEVLPNPMNVLNTILPKNVRSYFLFDGEKIDEFAKPEHEDQVKHAVYSVLKLEILDRAFAHITAVGGEYERELKSMNTGAHFKELLKIKESFNEEIKQTQKDLESTEKELRSTQIAIGRLDSELFRQEEARVLIQKRKDLMEDEKTLKIGLDGLLHKIREISNSGYIMLGYQAVQKGISIVDEKRNKGEIPAGIREQFIRDLIDKKSCICGRPLTDSGPEMQTLTGLLKKSLSSKIEDIVLEAGGLMHKLISKGEHIFAALRNLKAQKAEHEDRLTRIQKELEEISERLENVGNQEIEALEKKRKDAQKRERELLIDIGGLKQRILEIEKDIEKNDREIKKTEGLVGKAKQAQKKLTLAMESAKAVQQVHERFAKEMRGRIEQETKEIFTKFLWKESQFPKLELTDDYKLKVLDRWGSPARPELSAGERQLLSLAFITALAGASEASAPMVMDTPFGRLDDIPRVRICEALPDLVEQLILFVTGTELLGEARKVLEPRIGKEYKLEWNVSTGCTAVIGVKS